MSRLRDLVNAWQEQVAKCKPLFAETLAAINKELDAVGGYATTSPDAKGFCRDYERREDTFGGGGTELPKFTVAGDRCFAIEKAWRAEIMEMMRRRDAVRAAIAELGGGTEPEDVALAIYKSEERL